ncbi:uncharacterized protein LOC128724962 [Anopheles nili]|uniref:uncharacterized protein LOC128724962 n=1 Tax=Anopheles nili TaxID=185578 RepID=UPI00237C4F09|nr:uncharacterized protein LOC128724962 [Anopheles nili]
MQTCSSENTGDSTCCDDDFSWVCTQDKMEAPKASIESDQRSLSCDQRSLSQPQHVRHSRQSAKSDTVDIGSAISNGKPPRPTRETGSLDRRRRLRSTRNERDNKSRSTHSLKEKSSSSEMYKHVDVSSNRSLNLKDFHDSSSLINYNSIRCESQHHCCPPHQNSRLSSNIRNLSPLPPISAWDPQFCWSNPHYHHQHQSREELRLIDYYCHQQSKRSQDVSCSSACCRNYYYTPTALCCSFDHRSQWNHNAKRQDTDERLRRFQTDKEALALQVKALTEQVQSQTSRINELENTIKEKNQLLSNADDLLQRVSVFAKTVGIQIDKQKEMLSRSSLETQKLELMSAMSELKLQQAALERENLELRTNFITSTGGSTALVNGGPTNGPGSTLTNVLNNNTIASSMLKRPHIITNTRMVGMSSAPVTSLISSPIHHGSHGNLQQTAVSPTTPKTPPASYRHRIDVHYSSLPRQAFATTLSTVSTSSGSSTTTESNANLKRNAALAPAMGEAENFNLKQLEAAATSTQEIQFYCSNADRTTDKSFREQYEVQRANTDSPSPIITTKIENNTKSSGMKDQKMLIENKANNESALDFDSNVILCSKTSILTPSMVAQPRLKINDKLRGFSVPNLGLTI